MSERASGTAKLGEGKKEHKNKPASQKYKRYTFSGETVSRTKHCVKCGPGVFLATHKDRLYCGKCHYTEFLGKAK